MTLTVDVLARTPLPMVRAVVSEVPAGLDWALTGTADGWSWPVAEGVSDGTAVVVADPWAPLGVPATYELRFGTSVQRKGPVTRRYPGEDALTDLAGRKVVDFRWLAAGGDEREGDRRAVFFDVQGAEYPPALYAPTAGAGGGSLIARTIRPHTDTLRQLLRTNRPLILLHNEDCCVIPGCDVQPARTVYLTEDGNDVTGRVDVRQREWRLSYRLVSTPPGWAPVVTVADLRERFKTVGALRASSLTVGGVKQGDW